ncbi:MAG: hypothetical protein KUG78_10810 [Kangiellaceae bacterium]|nr:hypothetical protein [Kangiellaceae bacterium]
MRPKTIYLAYFALGFLVLSCATSIYGLYLALGIKVFSQLSTILSVGISILLMFTSVIAIISLANRYDWSRIMSVLVVGGAGALSLNFALYYLLTLPQVGKAMLMTSVPIGLVEVVVAYIIYSSKPLQKYLQVA